MHAQLAPRPGTPTSPSAGPSITGLNHVLLVCKDMNATANFYVNILGLKLKATTQQSMGNYPGRLDQADNGVQPPRVNRLYFFETPDGTMITFAELPKNDTTADHSMFQPNFWPGPWNPAARPSKLDHLGFNVATLDDLAWFQKRLREHGVAVSGIEDRVRYVKSIYFHDPDQIPLEIATWDFGASEWKDYKDGEYLRDPDLVPSLRHIAGAAKEAK